MSFTLLNLELSFIAISDRAVSQSVAQLLTLLLQILKGMDPVRGKRLSSNGRMTYPSRTLDCASQKSQSIE